MKTKKPELMSPVSDFVSLRAAIDAGADSVYFGLKELNMRITAKNFRLSELAKVVNICRKSGVKAYLALNTIIYDDELARIKKIISAAKRAKVDAVICWDAAVIEVARRAKMPFHISTQASISNSESAKFYKRLGAKRIVLARELTIEQIKRIRKEAGIAVECFIHGAMCVSVSGSCFMSQFVFGRSANRGDCLQPCRRAYDVYYLKDIEEGHELRARNNFVMSPKDLCTLPFIDKLIGAKIDAFKLEGRARSPEYVKVVTECYREAIDAHFEGRLTQQLKSKLMKKLSTVYNRGFSPGFYMGVPIDRWTAPDSKATEKKLFVGVVRNYYPKPGVAEIKVQSGSIRLGDRIMFQGPTTGVFEQKAESMEINHKKVCSAEKGKNVGIKVNKIVRRNDNVFMIVKL